MTTTDTPAVDNGVNVEALLGARAASHRRPGAGASSNGEPAASG